MFLGASGQLEGIMAGAPPHCPIVDCCWELLIPESRDEQPPPRIEYFPPFPLRSLGPPKLRKVLPPSLAFFSEPHTFHLFIQAHFFPPRHVTQIPISVPFLQCCFSPRMTSFYSNTFHTQRWSSNPPISGTHLYPCQPYEPPVLDLQHHSISEPHNWGNVASVSLFQCCCC